MLTQYQIDFLLHVTFIFSLPLLDLLIFLKLCVSMGLTLVYINLFPPLLSRSFLSSLFSRLFIFKHVHPPDVHHQMHVEEKTKNLPRDLYYHPN